ncbi:hypothetical protein BD413DRAFT_291510 [Trametes elegans]|nr:hypothetical protein BD413DRAFT_291510 [Trametes elegans]
MAAPNLQPTLARPPAVYVTRSFLFNPIYSTASSHIATRLSCLHAHSLVPTRLPVCQASMTESVYAQFSQASDPGETRTDMRRSRYSACHCEMDRGGCSPNLRYLHILAKSENRGMWGADPSSTRRFDVAGCCCGPKHSHRRFSKRGGGPQTSTRRETSR